MVTGAAWADMDGDGNKELIITGEWMSPHIYSFSRDHFVEIKTNLDSLPGLWKSIAVADVNNDGKNDLILGNIGENFYLRPDAKNPVKLWINDFNQNGNIDKILTRTVDGRDVPVFLKHDMQDEVPMIKKQNLKHSEYAQKSIQELFDKTLLSKSVIKQFNFCSSVIAINRGNGNFIIEKLPVRAQLSCINAICVSDVNNDGFVDLVTGGNEGNFLPQFGRLDASYGDLLINNKKGNFTWISSGKSGIKTTGVVRDIAEIKNKNKRCFLFLRNDDYPVMYKLNAATGLEQ